MGAHRHRPVGAQPPGGIRRRPAAGRLSEAILQRIGQATASGHLSADDIADATFDAVRDGRFYVIPHQDIKAAISLRMKDILETRNPTLTRVQ